MASARNISSDYSPNILAQSSYKYSRLRPPILRSHAAAAPIESYRENFDVGSCLGRYFHSLAIKHKYQKAFLDIQYYTFFVGWGRSGHSLFGSLLDAHPSFSIAHELDVFPLVDAGLTKSQIFSLILENSETFAQSEGGRGWSGYSYAVPNQFQGNFRDLHVIGDKKGGGATEYIAFANPSILRKLRRRMNLPLKAIFYHRNPFDMLATVAYRGHSKSVSTDNIDFLFDGLAPTVERLRGELKGEEIIEVYHEDFVSSPKDTLKRVVEAYGENASASFLSDAAAIVKTSPHKSREKVKWTQKNIEDIEGKMKLFDFLKGRYSFES